MTEMQTIVLDIVRRHSGPDYGWCTSGIAQFVGRQPGKDSDRQHSALVSRTLRDLEAMGLVGRLDNESPIVWCRKD